VLVLFILSVAFLLYTYAIFPLLMVLWAKVAPRKVEKRYQSTPVSVVIAMRDEEAVVGDRVRNLLEQDFPEEMVEVILVSDGSTDRTVEIARGIDDPRVKIVELAQSQGKALAINAGMERARNEIVVFADARQTFSENAFAELTAMFQDPSVGAVSGELVLRQRSASDVREGVGLYWRYEKLIRRTESDVDSVVGATGSIYAIRRELFRPLPPNTLLDDFLIPMRIVLQGYRVIFVRSAQAFDWTAQSAGHEFARKVRTLTGNFQALMFEKALLNPRKNRVLFQMVSHKVTRLLAPYFMILALVSNLFLAHAFFRVTLALQLLFYVALLLRFTPLVSAPFGGIIRVAWTFAVMNAAAVMGLWMFVTGKDKHVWKKTANRAER
jgi:cellulose synthase/poly-beta-1,6-N-acetylglucosamine synthase-like glycosyltransferase